MVTLEQFKSYFRIDTDFEDELLQQFLDTATDYLKGAISDYAENYANYSEFTAKADLLTMIIAAEFYQNRDNSAHSLSYTIQSMMTQLQYFHNDLAASDTNTDTAGIFNDTIAMWHNGKLVDSGIKFASDEDIDQLLDDVGFKEKGKN